MSFEPGPEAPATNRPLAARPRRPPDSNRPLVRGGAAAADGHADDDDLASAPGAASPGDHDSTIDLHPAAASVRAPRSGLHPAASTARGVRTDDLAGDLDLAASTVRAGRIDPRLSAPAGAEQRPSPAAALAGASAQAPPAGGAAPNNPGSATLGPRMPDLGKAGAWGLLAVAGVLAGLLALSSVASFFNAYRIGEAVVRGEGEALHRLVERDFPRDRWITAVDLETILADDRDEGLRYLAILAPDDSVVVEAGVSVERPLRADDDRGVLAWIEDNLAGDGIARFERLFGPPPRRGDRPGPGSDAPLPLPPGVDPPPGVDAPPAAGVSGRPPPPRVVIEFEPRLAAAFFRQALRDLVVGLAVAVALVVTALVSHRQRQRAQAAEAGHAERRHLAALGEMSAVLAHEIRNPLASLKGHAQLLEEQLADNERRQAKARRIVEEAVRLEALTTSLLDFVRAGKLKAATGDPRAIARRAVELTDPARVVLDDAGAPEGWWLDAQRVEQALVNLVRNALQASPPGVTVELIIRREDGGLAFRVADRGPGVPAELRARIFDPFVTGRTQGTGLGLAVVSRVCERHGGKASVEERPGGGSVFRVWLPPADREDE
ncbi:HAMP domain-containing sensor histidine kinase [Nannocystis sp. SCPEA4]|uniref:sensor histidine kinase n=1 Tax=Nannocystis sp. SCPEA4 TaxID=2996787 RepID=UPI00226FFAF9|nr:HAMP domain-containing sensor histidine kinase [Nannocystis sp. SCPEA4]MCY1054010.1 HAMP domain-containing sensor histidine kinase [Nannocystis sp. SCPEA4]